MKTWQQKNPSSLVVKWRQSRRHDPCLFGVDSEKLGGGGGEECADQMFILQQDNDDPNNLRFAGWRGTGLHDNNHSCSLYLHI